MLPKKAAAVVAHEHRLHFHDMSGKRRDPEDETAADTVRDVHGIGKDRAGYRIGQYSQDSLYCLMVNIIPP